MSDSDKEEYDRWLELPTTILGENKGRHNATLFKVIHYFRSDGEWLDLTDDQRFERAWQWHLEHCKPQRSREEFNRICEWVKNKFGANRDKMLTRTNDRTKNTDTRNNCHEYQVRPPAVRDYVDDLVEKYHFKTMQDNDEIWFYDAEKGRTLSAQIWQNTIN